MTGSKEIITEMRPNLDNITVSYGDKSKSQVLGLGKVVVAHDITLVDVMLVETLGYNLLSVRALGKMGFAVFIDNDIVVLMWSKFLKVAFVGYAENDLYVVEFWGKPLEVRCAYLERPMWVGYGIADYPCQYENFSKSPQGWPYCWTKIKCFLRQRSCL